jgi:hypothetical protein
MIADEIIRILESGCLRQPAETGEAVLLREVRALREEVRQMRASGRRDRKHARRGAHPATKSVKRERNRLALYK